MARAHDEATRLASDPATPLKVLHELAMNNPEVHPLLAENPSTYPDLLTWLSGRGNPAVNAALARRAIREVETTGDQPKVEAADPSAETPHQPSPASPASARSSSPEPASDETIVAAPAVVPGSPAPRSAGSPTAIEEMPTAAMPAVQDANSSSASSSESPDPGAGAGIVGGSASSASSPAGTSASTPPGSGTSPASPAASSPAPVTPTSPERTSLTQRMPEANGGNSPARQSILGARQQTGWNYAPTYPQQPTQPVTQSPTQPASYEQSAPQETVYADPGAFPAQAQPSEDNDQRKNLLLWVFIGIVALLALIGILWVMGVIGGSDDESDPVDTSQETDAQSDPATDEDTDPTDDGETAPEIDLDGEASTLSAAVGASTCTSPDDDSEAFDAYASAVRDADGEWSDSTVATLEENLVALQEHCNPGYALATSQAADLDDVDLGEGWIEPVRSAPSGASELQGFSSPTGNIQCTLNESGAYCTIQSYNFTPGETCESGRPATVLVEDDDARFECDVQGSGGPALAYGQAAANGHMACTSDESGVECWNTLTGASFHVARAVGDVTDQEWGPGRQ